MYLVTSPHLYFQSFLCRKVTWHQPSGWTSIALREAGTWERDFQHDGQMAGRYEEASTPSLFEEVIQLKQSLTDKVSYDCRAAFLSPAIKGQDSGILF